MDFLSMVKVMLLECLLHIDVEQEIKDQEACRKGRSNWILSWWCLYLGWWQAEKMSEFPKSVVDNGKDSQAEK